MVRTVAGEAHVSAIPRQITTAERVAQQERETMEAIEQQERLKALGQSIVPPEPDPPTPAEAAAVMATLLAPDMSGCPHGGGPPCKCLSAEREAADASAMGRELATLRASGMTEDELAAYVAEMTGKPIPEPRSPAEHVLEQVEGRGAAALALGPPVSDRRKARWWEALEASDLSAQPRALDDSEMLAALTAVRDAKGRLERAEEALKAAHDERATASEALAEAQRTAAEGFAAIMG